MVTDDELPPHWVRVTEETIADGTTPNFAIIEGELREDPACIVDDVNASRPRPAST